MGVTENKTRVKYCVLYGLREGVSSFVQGVNPSLTPGQTQPCICLASVDNK